MIATHTGYCLHVAKLETIQVEVNTIRAYVASLAALVEPEGRSQGARRVCQSPGSAQDARP